MRTDSLPSFSAGPEKPGQVVDAQSKVTGLRSLGATAICRLLLVVLLGAPVMGLLAARAPNAVERWAVLGGKEATEMAELFGLSPGESLKLRLGRLDAWAVYLLKQDVQPPLNNDNNGSPARFNVVIYRAGADPRVTVGPFWLDLGTALPRRKAGGYTFSSPDLDDPTAAGWRKVAGAVKKARSPGQQRAAREFTASSGAKLRIEWCSVREAGGKVREFVTVEMEERL